MILKIQVPWDCRCKLMWVQRLVQKCLLVYLLSIYLSSEYDNMSIPFVKEGLEWWDLHIPFHITPSIHSTHFYNIEYYLGLYISVKIVGATRCKSRSQLLSYNDSLGQMCLLMAVCPSIDAIVCKAYTGGVSSFQNICRPVVKVPINTHKTFFSGLDIKSDSVFVKAPALE